MRMECGRLQAHLTVQNVGKAVHAPPHLSRWGLQAAEPARQLQPIPHQVDAGHLGPSPPIGVSGHGQRHLQPFAQQQTSSRRHLQPIPPQQTPSQRQQQQQQEYACSESPGTPEMGHRRQLLSYPQAHPNSARQIRLPTPGPSQISLHQHMELQQGSDHQQAMGLQREVTDHRQAMRLQQEELGRQQPLQAVGDQDSGVLFAKPPVAPQAASHMVTQDLFLDFWDDAGSAGQSAHGLPPMGTHLMTTHQTQQQWQGPVPAYPQPLESKGAPLPVQAEGHPHLKPGSVPNGFGHGSPLDAPAVDAWGTPSASAWVFPDPTGASKQRRAVPAW